MNFTPANMVSLLVTTILLFNALATTHPTNTSLPNIEQSSAQLVPRSMPQINCEKLRSAPGNNDICYLGYQACIREKHVVVDLSVWNSNCNRIGYATFVPPNGKFGLQSQLKYVTVAHVGGGGWEDPPTIDYAGRHYGGKFDKGPMDYRYNCYYPDENQPHMNPELRKATRMCLVPFGCQ